MSQGHPTRANWEFDRTKLSELKQIGTGNFGIVYVGFAAGIVPGQAKTKVAIKVGNSSILLALFA